jgi:hypothetical protein
MRRGGVGDSWSLKGRSSLQQEQMARSVAFTCRVQDPGIIFLSEFFQGLKPLTLFPLVRHDRSHVLIQNTDTRLVSGRDFSRAASRLRNSGFSPCGRAAGLKPGALFRPVRHH